MKKDNKFENEIAGDLATVSGVPVAEASKPKSKSTKASAGTFAIAAPTVTNPSANVIEWTMPTPDELGAITPEDTTDDRVVVITRIEWGDGVEAAGGLEIPQFSRNPGITKFENGVSNVGNKGHIPVGITSVRVGHITALKKGDSYDAESIDKPDQIAWSAWLAAIEFTA